MDIGVFETKTHLSELLQRVESGETFYITRRGQRIAELRPVKPEKEQLELGCAANSDYRMSSDFDDELTDWEEGS